MSKKNRFTDLDLTSISDMEQPWCDLPNEADDKIAESAAAEDLPSVSIERLDLAENQETRVALLQVRVGWFVIKGLTVWRGRNGRLRVFFPSYKAYGRDIYHEAIEVPADLRSAIEGLAIRQYRIKVEEMKQAERAAREAEKASRKRIKELTQTLDEQRLK